MINSATIIFPHQLFKNHPALQKSRVIYLVEEWLFFRQYHFHLQKLVLHRASMKCYKDWLQQNGYTVNYIDTNVNENDCRQLVASLASQKISHIHMAVVADDWLFKRVQNASAKHDITLHLYDSPNFLNTAQSTEDYFSKKKTYFQTDFYKWQRQQRGILLESNGQPIGGQWTFDSDNRQKFPKKEKAPVIELPQENKYIVEAKQYVKKYFPYNYGVLDTPCLFVVSFDDAANWLDEFLKNRFEKFGIYEDAIVAKEAILHHSVLTPMLNIGLLQPAQIIEAALAAAQEYDIPLNSLEGFIRQVMGWREFIHLVYNREGVKQRTTNYWKFKRKIPHSFWTGETGIPPIDITIKKILQTGYCHHIERLMVLGNFMQLCEFDPDEVYRWFMEMFIDAYDWVMVPNVYGMTQFADGGLMVTKPYISGSNYLMKMSDYEKGEWQPIWDGLFWRFMHVHRSFFLTNPRLGMLINTYDKMACEKQQNHLTNAEMFLAQLDNETTQ
ncbi:cryptochrome/photolyase family protein [Mucilaginibacter flavidus]|uniref:cryptochrome/photolyase family protein n=1 Tax=Mucilaginibacter flavidus TaxID=2949309 RepID=UPI0020931DF1|nr:cryptochrome/photolyase family protein [Mucilaginibacter flavidus]MCO5951096.1 cryptochrome/photolyase family protein [Mucilaginibacter flavidus]